MLMLSFSLRIALCLSPLINRYVTTLYAGKMGELRFTSLRLDDEHIVAISFDLFKMHVAILQLFISK